MASAATKKYQEAKTKMEEAKKQIEKIAKDAFRDMTTEFFENNPEIVSFGWTQYTPFWNDGDTCTFSANTEYPIVTFTAKDGKTLRYDENMGELTAPGTAVRDEEEDVEYSEDDGIDMGPYEREINKHSKAVSNFLSNFGDDDLLTMFDDHMEITVTRKKIQTKEYEHE